MVAVYNRPLSQNEYPEQYMGNASYDKDFNINSVQILGFDGVNLQRMNAVNMAIQIERNGSGDPIYLGIASPGSLVSEAKWQIRKLTFDGSSNLTALQFANGSPNFDSVWNDRASITYI